MHSSALTITFVVPVLNDAGRLTRCLQSIAANDGTGVEVVVVDNGSTDGSDRVAVEAGATLLREPALSISSLRNAGARAACGEIVAFVDADHEISPSWVSAARAAFSESRAGAAGAPYSNPGLTWVQRIYGGLRDHPRGRQPVEWLGAGNLAVRRSLFVAIGGFDERLRSCEDVDFCRRLRAVGQEIVADPRLASVHLGDPASLHAVFFGELWRGRDNLAASFRRPLCWRDVVSAAIPATELVGLAVTAVALVLGAFWLALATASVVAALVAARTFRISLNRDDWRPLAVARCAAVALAYEGGRAFALVARARHATRRRTREHGMEAAA